MIDAKLPNHALQALNNVRTYVHTCVFENLFLNMTRKREREREKYARAYDDAILWVFPLHFPLSSSFSFVLSLLLFRASSSLFSLLLLSLSLSLSLLPLTSLQLFLLFICSLLQCIPIFVNTRDYFSIISIKSRRINFDISWYLCNIYHYRYFFKNWICSLKVYKMYIFLSPSSFSLSLFQLPTISLVQA